MDKVRRLGLVLASSDNGDGMGKLGELMPKSLVNIPGVFKSTLEINIDQLLDIGVDLVVVVTGYKSEMINSFVSKKYSDKEVLLLHNPHYNRSNYESSLSMFATTLEGLLRDSNDLVILDSNYVVDKDYLEQLYTNSISDFRVLARRTRYISSDSECLLATTDERRGVVDRLIYPSTNGDSCGDYLVVGESMGVWYLSRDVLVSLVETSQEYLEKFSEIEKEDQHISSLEYLSEKYGCCPVFVDGDNWFRLKSESDIYLTESQLEWMSQ